MWSRASFLVSLVCPAACVLRLPPRSALTGSTGSGYFWPEPRGSPGSYSASSSFVAPRWLTPETLAWTWANDGPFHNLSRWSTAAHSGLVMDDKFNSYLSSTDGIRKLSPDGEVLWFVSFPTWRIPSLVDGKLYITSNEGEAMALDMETGQVLWRSKFTDVLGTDISGVAVVDGVLLAEADGNKTGGARSVVGLDARDGHLLWKFPTDNGLWNFMPMVTNDGTVVFQDKVGGVYHIDAHNGNKIWKAGYASPGNADFTDGLAMFADDIVYAVHSDGMCCQANQPATLRAYNVSTGQEIWKNSFGHPANSQPAIGYIGQGKGLRARKSVVMPIGAQPTGTMDVYNSSIIAFDAKTGEKIWEFEPAPYVDRFVAGDAERIAHHTLCLPNPYGSASIDARGTVYTGHFNGNIYAIRDDNGDSVIQDNEVSAYDTGAGFSHGGAVIAPGMLVIPSCDGVFAFKVKED